MARSHAKIFCSIWGDGEWVSLSQGSQHLYELLLSQQKLTLVGLLTYTPNRWARLASDTTLASVERNTDELRAGRYVAVDYDTEELLIRTLVKNEVANGRLLDNTNLMRGLWNAWKAIESSKLKQLAVENIPASVWDSTKATPPVEALELRDQLSRMPSSAPFERPIQTTPSDDSLEQAVPTSLRPSPFPGVTSQAATEALLESLPAPQAAVVDNSDVVGAAIELLVTRELLRNPTRSGNPNRHADAVRRGKRKDLGPQAHQLVHQHPNVTAAELADLLEPPTTDPVAEMQRASRATAEAGMATTAQLREVEPPPPDVVAAVADQFKHLPRRRKDPA